MREEARRLESEELLCLWLPITQVLDSLLEGRLKADDACIVVFPNLSPTTPAYVMPFDAATEQICDTEEEPVLEAEADDAAGGAGFEGQRALPSPGPPTPPPPPPAEGGPPFKGGQGRSHEGGCRRRKGEGAFGPGCERL